MTIEGPRAARQQELRSVTELANRVFRAGEEGTMGTDFPLLFHEDNIEDLRIFADDGRPISLVGMFQRDIYLVGTRHRSCAIGAVCTDPDYRGQGLATRLLQDAREKALKDGADICLISGKRSLYRRQGYVDVGGYYYCTIERDGLPRNSGFALRPWTPEDVPALVRLHSAEPVRFVRTPQEFLTLLRAERIRDGLADTRVVVAEGSADPVAYVTYRRPGARRLAEGTVAVDEMAGSRWAVVQALDGLFEEYGVQKVMVNCLDCDVEMRALTRQFGWPCEPHGFRGTVGIIDPARFWQACAPLFRERLGEERSGRLAFTASGGRRESSHSFKLTYGQEELRLDGMSDLTGLVFLPEGRRSELTLELPAHSELAGLLSELFPLPLVDYGLNYI